MARSEPEVADVFRRYGAAYRETHGASLCTAQRRVMSAIELCRTAALGGHIERCDRCDHQRIWYNSCRDRHCPKCQSLARAQWLEDRQSELLDTQYFMWSSLFRSRLPPLPCKTSRSSTTFCSEPPPRHCAPLRLTPSIWAHRLDSSRCSIPGARLLLAIRICIASFQVAAFPGMARDGFPAGRISSCPVSVLSRLFRRLFLDYLRQQYDAGACKLSTTILSFSSSDQRRRRPVSTTWSRSICALTLSLSIRTVSISRLTRQGGRYRIE